MDTVLFNFHDLVLVLTGFECLLFALLLGVSYHAQPKSTIFFIGFLLCHTLIPLHELIFWGKEFRIWMLDVSPNLFFFGSYSYFLDGPLLFFFVRALVYKDFSLHKRHLVHLLPCLFYFALLIVTFYSLDYKNRFDLIETQHIAYSSPYLYFDFIGKYLRVFYALGCIVLIRHYGERLLETYADINRHDLAWLKIMIACVLLLFSWDAILLSIKLIGLFSNHFDLDLLNVIGVSAYHLNFLVLNVLIFLKFTRFKAVEAVDQKQLVDSTDSEDQHDQEYIQRIKEGMKDADVYAMPNITVDKLAKALDVPPKKLSFLIKTHFNVNFYEFVNRYRIEAAKELLLDPAYKNKTITEIYYEVGFNSKSVFNTFFKKLVNMTPSQYRDQVQSNPQQDQKGIF